MTNEDKANEIAKCDCQKHYKGFDLCNTYKFHEKNYCGRKAAALEAMEWKDEQFAKEREALIDKACEWLSKWEDPYYDNGLVEGFKKAMKGGNDE